MTPKARVDIRSSLLFVMDADRSPRTIRSCRAISPRPSALDTLDVARAIVQARLDEAGGSRGGLRDRRLPSPPSASARGRSPTWPLNLAQGGLDEVTDALRLVLETMEADSIVGQTDCLCQVGRARPREPRRGHPAHPRDPRA